MAVRDRLREAFTVNGAQVEQARTGSHDAPFGLTPTPTSPDVLAFRRHLALRAPRGEHVDLLFQFSQPLASVVKKVRRLVWEQPLTIVPAIGKRCPSCGLTTDEDIEACPSDGAELKDPDETQRQRFESFLANANRNRQSLEKVGRRLTDDGNVHGTGFAIHLFQYLTNDDGVVEWANLQEVRHGDPVLIQPLMDEAGDMGDGTYVCLSCRGQPNYRPQREPSGCPRCGNVVYEAWWVEEAPTGQNFYLPNEVEPLTWHYEDGSSPLFRLWQMLTTLMFMERVVLQAFDPRFGKAPGVILVTMGGDTGKMREWVKREEQRRKENPYGLSHLHIPIRADLGSEQPPLDAKVLNVSDEFILGHQQEIRDEYKSAIREEYGLMPLTMGDTEGVGGLNEEREQGRMGAVDIRAIHREFEDWLDRVADMLNVTDWQARFEDPDVEDDLASMQNLQAMLQAGEAAARNGLTAEFKAGELVIHDGTFEPPETGAGFGGDVFGGFGPGEQGGNGHTPRTTESPLVAALSPPEISDAEFLEWARRQLEQAYVVVEQQVPSNAADLTKSVQVLLEDPGAPDFIADELMASYDGIPSDVAQQLQQVIVDELSRPTGFSMRDMTHSVREVLTQAGLEDLAGRAKTIARTETGAIITEAKRRAHHRLVESRPGEDLRFGVRGANDHRTTKMSRWIRSQVPDEGLPLDELEQLLDRAIEVAKTGAFEEGGRLSHVPGTPVTMPQDFRRRGYLTFFSDRDEVVRVFT